MSDTNEKNTTNEILEIEQKARQELKKHKETKHRQSIKEEDLDFTFPSEHSYGSNALEDKAEQADTPVASQKQQEKVKINVKNAVIIISATVVSLFLLCIIGFFIVNPQFFPFDKEQQSTFFSGDTAVIRAVKNNDITKLENLLQKNTDPNKPNKNGETALYYAFYQQGFDMLKILADNGVDLNTPIIDNTIKISPDGIKEYCAPIIIAAKQGNKEMLSELSRLGADINVTHLTNLYTALHYTAEMGNSDIITHLAQLGANLESRNKNNQTPLHRAVYNENTAVGAELLAVGANPNATETNLWTPMHHAAQAGKAEFIERLISAKANVNAQTTDGWTPLHLAANAGRANCVEILIKFGKANPNMKNNSGETPLNKASARGDTKIVDFLLANGAK